MNIVINLFSLLVMLFIPKDVPEIEQKLKMKENLNLEYKSTEFFLDVFLFIFYL